MDVKGFTLYLLLAIGLGHIASHAANADDPPLTKAQYVAYLCADTVGKVCTSSLDQLATSYGACFADPLFDPNDYPADKVDGAIEGCGDPRFTFCLMLVLGFDTDAFADRAVYICDRLDGSDMDGDGVPYEEDACPGTAPDQPVLADGCAVEQKCACGGTWKNHGAFVRCSAHVTEEMVFAGLISEAEGEAIVAAAAESRCGHKAR